MIRALLLWKKVATEEKKGGGRNREKMDIVASQLSERRLTGMPTACAHFLLVSLERLPRILWRNSWLLNDLWNILLWRLNYNNRVVDFLTHPKKGLDVLTVGYADCNDAASANFIFMLTLCSFNITIEENFIFYSMYSHFAIIPLRNKARLDCP